MKLELVIVRAYDLETTPGWLPKSDKDALLKSPGKRVVSVGFLIRNDDTAVVIASTLGEIEKKVADSNGERLRVEKNNASAIAAVKESYRVDLEKLSKEKKGLEDRVTGLRAELDRLVSKVVGAAA